MFYIKTWILSLLYKYSSNTNLYKTVSFQIFLFIYEKHKIPGKDFESDILSVEMHF